MEEVKFLSEISRALATCSLPNTIACEEQLCAAAADPAQLPGSCKWAIWWGPGNGHLPGVSFRRRLALRTAENHSLPINLGKAEEVLVGALTSLKATRYQWSGLRPAEAVPRGRWETAAAPGGAEATGSGRWRLQMLVLPSKAVGVLCNPP